MWSPSPSPRTALQVCDHIIWNVNVCVCVFVQVFIHVYTCTCMCTCGCALLVHVCVYMWLCIACACVCIHVCDPVHSSGPPVAVVQQQQEPVIYSVELIRNGQGLGITLRGNCKAWAPGHLTTPETHSFACSQ